MSQENKRDAVCGSCASSDVWVDATAEWNTDTQTWELKSTFDMAFCTVCDGETIIKMIPLEDEK